MAHSVIEDIETHVVDRVIRRKIIKTDDPQYLSGYRYALHYAYTDSERTILRYDNGNETVGWHERHTPDSVTEIEFPGMMKLRDRFIETTEEQS